MSAKGKASLDKREITVEDETVEDLESGPGTRDDSNDGVKMFICLGIALVSLALFYMVF